MTISRGRARSVPIPHNLHPPSPSTPPPPSTPPRETFQQDPPGLICPQTVKMLTRPYTSGGKGNARFIFLSTERKAKNSFSLRLSLSAPPLSYMLCLSFLHRFVLPSSFSRNDRGYFTHYRVPDSWIRGPCTLQDSGLVSVTLSFINTKKLKNNNNTFLRVSKRDEVEEEKKPRV